VSGGPLRVEELGHVLAFGLERAQALTPGVTAARPRFTLQPTPSLAVQLLQEHGADVNACDEFGNTPS
jgi:hypothetical protein